MAFSPAKQNTGDAYALILDLYLQYYPMLLREAAGILYDLHAAEDVVQDLFACLIAHADRTARIGHDSLRSYLVVSIRRRCIDYLRKRKTVQKYLPYCIDEKVQAAPFSRVEQAAIERMECDALKDALLQLPPRQRQVVICKIFFGMSNAEIAERMHIRPSSVRAHLFRTRRCLNP